MQTEKLQIDNLLKVSLLIEAGLSRDELNLLEKPEKLEFIYGVAACGITPLEKLLYQKGVGDDVIAAVDLKNPGEFFGPLAPDLPQVLRGRGETYLKLAIHSVQQPVDLEIVRALASGGGCGGDCDCGCGC